MTAPVQPQQNYYGGDQQHNQNQYAPPTGAPPQQNYGYGQQGANEGYYGQQQGVTQPQGAYMK